MDKVLTSTSLSSSTLTPAVTQPGNFIQGINTRLEFPGTGAGINISQNPLVSVASELGAQVPIATCENKSTESTDTRWRGYCIIFLFIPSIYLTFSFERSRQLNGLATRICMPNVNAVSLHPVLKPQRARICWCANQLTCPFKPSFVFPAYKFSRWNRVQGLIVVVFCTVDDMRTEF